MMNKISECSQKTESAPALVWFTAHPLPQRQRRQSLTLFNILLFCSLWNVLR